MSAGAPDDNPMARMLGPVPQAEALGLTVLSAGEARSRMHVPWRSDLVGDPASAVLAGGVITTLLDHCCGIAISTARATPGATATLDLRIDYMRPAAPGSGVTADAHCYKITRNIGFVRAEAWDVDPADPIATVQAAFMVTDAPGPSA